jgi:UDP-N-acetylglucosamine acyltransferase
MSIHPTAIIDKHAELDASVEVGPYVVIDGPVRIGAGTRIRSHVWLTGWTQIGERCDIFPFAALGGPPQDSHHQGERSYCRIGDRVIIREAVTIHRGTQPESATEIGDDCFITSQCHIGHNCRLGRGVTLIFTAGLSGHVEVGDRAILSGGSVIHQFARIGELAFVAANARVGNDVPPFMICHGESTIVNVNIVGLRRAGFNSEARQELRDAYRMLYRSGLPFRKAVDQLATMVRTDAGQRLVQFLRSESKRGFAAGGTHIGRRRAPEADVSSDNLA